MKIIHWRECFDLLCDSQLLLRRAIDAIEKAYEGQLRINLLAIEFDELTFSINELITEYEKSELVSGKLLSKFHYYLFNTRESIAIACSQPEDCLCSHYIFCKAIVYASIFLYESIERETLKLIREHK